jgi:eukaryotic-like serine/threonine-protein kinase
VGSTNRGGDDATTTPLPPTAAMPVGRNVARSRPRLKTSEPIELAPGTRFGRFELIRELARGGMGQVFLARDVKLGRRVAIKFLLRNDPDFVAHFVVEARATARCTHENIITIYEVGEYAGLPYMVLEYLEGKSLTDVLRTRPTVEQFTEIMISVVGALARAHEHGIVHRDLKPSNIFITDRGVVKVLDFGIAQLEDADAIDNGRWIAGTAPFMSPEQWNAAVVDHRSDIWQVGILWWRALTTKHPAGSINEEDDLRRRVCDLETPLPSIATAVPTLPPPIVALVDRCVAKRPDDRYQRAQDILIALRQFTAPVRLTEDVCPYRGLAAFGENDAKYFFGRSAEIRTARTMLERSPLLAVVGPSGVGKSSFVHAGLVPALRASGSWHVYTVRPGRKPLARLAAILARGGTEELDTSPGMFGDHVRDEAARTGGQILIVVDQLEELFTLCHDPRERHAFLAALLAAADDPSAPVRVVMSMRTEFVDRLAPDQAIWDELSRGLLFLAAPNRDNLREALVRPAELAGYAFESESIVDEMLQVATSRAALPLLSFAATRLWDARDRDRRLLTAAAYREMGGVGGAFAGHADQVVAGMPAAQRMLLRAVVTRLVTPDGTRAIVERRELLALGPGVQTVLDRLVEARLIQVAPDQDEPSVEIVHEMLITEWPTLTRWLDAQQAVRGFMNELRQAVRQWLAHDREPESVWRGALAEDAFAIERRHVLELSRDERAYLDAVRRLWRSARRKRIAALVSVIAVLALIIAGGSVAVVRISKAEQAATEQARAAERDAARAKAAEAESARQLEELKQAKGIIVKTDSELATKNAELERALEESKRESSRAKAAEAAATAAKANVQTLLDKERARVKTLEAEANKLRRGGLR